MRKIRTIMECLDILEELTKQGVYPGQDKMWDRVDTEYQRKALSLELLEVDTKQYRNRYDAITKIIEEPENKSVLPDTDKKIKFKKNRMPEDFPGEYGWHGYGSINIRRIGIIKDELLIEGELTCIS